MGRESGLGTTVIERDGVALVLDFDGLGREGLMARIDGMGVDNLHADFHGFDGEYFDGTRPYLERIGRHPEEVERLAGVLESRIEPVYQRYAEELGLGEDASEGLRARTD